MRVESDTFWVVPFLDDVAEFLSEHGMPESSSIVAEAAAKVQICSLIEAGQQQHGNPESKVVSFSPRPRAPRWSDEKPRLRQQP